MLGKPSKGIQEVIAHFGKIKFTLEFKYDGERAQVPSICMQGHHALYSYSIRSFPSDSSDGGRHHQNLQSKFGE